MAGNVPSSGIPGRRCWTVPLSSGRGVGKALSEVLYVIYDFSTHCAPDTPSALCHSWRGERTGGGQSPPPPVPPGSGQQNRHCVVPSTYPCRLRVGPRQRPCKTRPSARIHAACRERLSDVEAATPAVSAALVGNFRQVARTPGTVGRVRRSRHPAI